jgi:hypothetical protein
MNLGIYVDHLGDDNNLFHISECVNAGLSSGELNDASIFFDNVGFNKHKINCGIFNATDMWNFHGSLIATSLNTLISASNIVNNINLYYYYGLENKLEVLQFLKSVNRNCNIICNSENAAKYLFRISNTKPIGISNNYKEIINIIRKNEDGYQKNSTNVYRSK